MSPNNHEQIIRELFDELFYPLVLHAFKYVKDYEQSEEIVQAVFVKVWQNFDKISPLKNKEGYLFKSVRNSSLNFLKHVKVRQQYVEEKKAQQTLFEKSPEEIFTHQETRESIRTAIDKLPETWKKALIYSKYQNLTYHEIAIQMDISPKTVEKYISKAYAFLRVELKDLFLIGFMFWDIF